MGADERRRTHQTCALDRATDAWADPPGRGAVAAGEGRRVERIHPTRDRGPAVGAACSVVPVCRDGRWTRWGRVAVEYAIACKATIPSIRTTDRRRSGEGAHAPRGEPSGPVSWPRERRALRRARDDRPAEAVPGARGARRARPVGAHRRGLWLPRAERRGPAHDDAE